MSTSVLDRRTGRLWCYLFAAGALSCGHPTGSGPANREVRVALTADAITWLPIRLAQTLGYASEEGITITTFDFAGLSKGMEALLGGSADVAPGGVSQAIQAAVQGRAVRCFLVLYSRPAIALVIAPHMIYKIRTIADLNGRRVGVSSPGSPTHQFLNFLLTSHGLSPSNVSVITVGTGATSIAALEHGELDAVVLVSNAVTMYEARHPEAALLADARSEEGTKQIFGVNTFPVSGLNARDEWLRSNSETARHFVAALKKGMQWMAAHSPEEIRAKIPEASRMPDPEADLQAIRQLQRTMSRDGSISPESVEAVRKFVAASDERVRKAHIDLAALYTNEFVKGN